MEHTRDKILWIGLAAASVLLALAPLEWLVTSWHDPSYQSHGAVYALVMAALVVVSIKSSAPAGPPMFGRVFMLFFAAAAVRLLGQMLAINILSAFALAVDVYALAALMRLDQRRFAISPFWLAVFFLFALPLGPILQRVAGFPLQMMSAEVACQMLSPFFADLICEGVRLRVNGADILVDLPCSGASGLLLMVSLWAFLNVMFRPGLMAAARGLVIVVVFALLGNALRIALLAGGLALGFDTMAPVLHGAIGVLTLGLSAGMALLFYRPAPCVVRVHAPAWIVVPRWARVPLVGFCLVTAVVIVNAPKRPVDISAPVQAAALPAQLVGQRAVPVALSEAETYYFTAFGGSAQKAQYGPMGLNVVQTSSPLRHLHAPETCLRGMGFEVRFLGTRFDPIPTSLYEAIGPDGQRWTVAVSFVSDGGHTTPGVGEAVWSWLSGSSRNWRAVQRITPADLPETIRHSYELAVLAALDLTQGGT